IGGDGSDTYIINKNSNNTIIKDKEFVNLIDGGDDTLILKDTIKDSLSFKYTGVFNKDLVIDYKTTDGIDKTITILNQSNPYSLIEKIEFDDKTFITKDDIDKIISNGGSLDNTLNKDNQISNDINLYSNLDDELNLSQSSKDLSQIDDIFNSDELNQADNNIIAKIVSEFRDDSFNTFGGSSNLNDNSNLSNNLNLSSRNLNSTQRNSNQISEILNDINLTKRNLERNLELNSTEINSPQKEYEFISQNQINKIIEELNIYTNSSIDTNFNFTEFNNDKFIQIYGG
ncbi:MAG: hypothetical protein MR902_09745, partial [Campylobacter sp.]|nr:hypothetical protein [Campylobacter sp.]